MWVLITVVLKLTESGKFMPVYENAILHKTIESCEVNMEKVYSDLELLKANYPVTLEYRYNDENNKYIRFKYKPDYTKPEKERFYHCLKVKN